MVENREKRSNAEDIVVRMTKALTEEAHRIRELEDEDVTAFKTLERLEKLLTEIPHNGGTTHSQEPAEAIGVIRRLRGLLDVRCAELANIWEPRLEGLILDMADLRLLMSDQHRKTL